MRFLVRTDGAPLTMPGTYLTDGRLLLRVHHRLPGPEGDAIELEDCRTLELLVVDVDELAELGLRVVRPAPNPTA